MNKSLDYLLQREWSMGNGQCPDCCGCPESWFGHPCHLTPDTIGHKADCALAGAIKDAGGSPVYIGDFKSEDVYEVYWPNGLMSTRIKHPRNPPGPVTIG